MDRKFLLLVACACSGVFAATWMLTGVHPQELHAQEFPAKDKQGKAIVFTNCQQVEKAGMAPLYAGRPGYTHELDPDGTGVACRPH